MAQRKLKFRAHFNRVNMQRGNRNVWTVHNSKACYQGERIILRVPVESVYKPDGPQPRAYFIGYGRIVIMGGTTICVF